MLLCYFMRKSESFWFLREYVNLDMAIGKKGPKGETYKRFTNYSEMH